MISTHLKKLFLRDLAKLSEEIGKYQSEENLWKTAPGISNSGGNLCLHLLGNLNHYVGARLGNFDYVRERDQEFVLKNIPREQLLRDIAELQSRLGATLDGLDADRLAEEYPEQVFGYPMTVEYFLLHLLAHLSYHLGQVNYHRRLLDQA